MIETILGSLNSERVLIYLIARDEGYAREIARFYDISLTPVQKQLARLETGGVLVSRAVGRTRVFTFSPRYPFLQELSALLEKALSFYPEDEQNALLMNRRRPRKADKPI